MKVALRVRITGPLTPHFEGFSAELTAQGYADRSLAHHLRLMADLSRWLETAGVSLAGLDCEVVQRFLSKRQRTHARLSSRRALEPLLRYLGAAGMTPAAPDHPVRREELRAYERYLVEERDVAPARRALCLAVAEDFLGEKRVTALKAADVTRFVKTHASEPGLLGRLSALRSVLRFLFISTKTAANLVYAVPSSPRWTRRSLPQALEPDELDAVLGTCDRRTLVGCRDYAVLLLLSRLGLRAGEVAALRFEDVDWKAGEIAIRGKGRSLSRLPLPVDVGRAISSYLRRAVRTTATRSVFVRCRAPYSSLTSSAVVVLATRALREAGVEHGGAHRLRHTAATQMLRGGASMTEIAQVLRHRHVNTTAIYAKVDRDALRALAKAWPVDRPDVVCVREMAQPWPGGAA